MDFLISVIVPVFNIEKYISKCIESILGQTYGNLQVILVDDGSTDASGEICDAYARKDKRVQVIHKKNEGPVSARSAGLEAACGEYVGFVDGDDYIEASFYQVLVQDIIENDVDFVHTGYIFESEHGDIVSNKFGTKRFELLEENSLYLIREALVGNEFHISPSMWSKLYKREFIQKCHARVSYELTYGEDLVCLIVCLLEAQSIYLHNVAMYHYVKRSGSLMDVAYSAVVVKIAELYQIIKKVLKEYGKYECMRISLERNITRSVLYMGKRTGVLAECMSFYYMKNIERVKGKRIVLYGAGNVGQGYYLQLCKYSFCSVVGWVDRSYQRFHFDYAEVLPVTQLAELVYDVILIAVKDEDRAEQIKQDLIEKWNIPVEKIVWEMPGSILEEI